jgi:hypothetical protein
MRLLPRCGPHEEFGGEIRDGSRALLGVGGRGADPALQHAIAHRVGQRHVVVGLGGKRRKLALDIEEVVEEGVLERLLAHGNAVFVDLRGRSAGDVREAGYWRTHGRLPRDLLLSGRCKIHAGNSQPYLP